MSTSNVVQAEDRTEFTEMVERHRREIQVHCYRMLGSFEESEDLVQETFLRAWRGRKGFEGRATLRTWLYRIATNACLDAIARRPPAQQTADGPEVAWLQPFPDRLLDELADGEDAPDVAVVSKETIELAFLVAIQHLPPRQRAVLILRDVLGWSAKETAALLEASVASVNSLLQRARATMKEQLPERRVDWHGSELSAADRAMLDRYVEAHDLSDPEIFAEMLREDARFSMPPEPGVWIGRQAIIECWREGFELQVDGQMRAIHTSGANRQPAVACYVKKPGSDHFRPMAFDVLTIAEGKLAEVVTFPPSLFQSLGLPDTL